MSNRRRVASFFLLLLVCAAGSTFAADSQGDAARLKLAYRFERSKWIYVHLEGSPADIGYQHGYLLSAEIADGFNTVRFKDTHRTKRDWEFFRETAKTIIWPKVDPEYQEELKGIAEGLKAKGVPMDLWDVVALNAMEEVPDYYVPWLDRQQKTVNAPKLVPPGNCSAFVATGSMTKDHKPVIAHSNWTDIATGSRWTIVFDIVPTHGFRIIQDGFPGIIVSDDDFGINSSGLMVTETLAAGLPMLLIDVIEGQETGNALFVTEQGAGEVVKEPLQFLETAYHWLSGDQHVLRERAEAARNAGRPHAAYDAAELAWGLAAQNRG